MNWKAVVEIAPLVIEFVLWAVVIVANVKYDPAKDGRCAAQDCDSCPFPRCEMKCNMSTALPETGQGK